MDMIDRICEMITTLFMLCGVLLMWLGLYGFIVVENRPELIDRLWELIFGIGDNDDFE